MFLRQKHLLFYSYYLFLISHYYLIYFDYLSLMIVLVLAQLSNRQFVDSFVEFLILTVLHICQYSFYIFLSLSFFYFFIFRIYLSILLFCYSLYSLVLFYVAVVFLTSLLLSLYVFVSAEYISHVHDTTLSIEF